tara:strand:+ start:2372 stop:3292 length:921 start_codon:yes stop_codon:yes gene_type:complete
MNYIDLFSGLGGFPLGAYWAGLKVEHHYFSEVDPYCVDLYRKQFPEAVPLGNIKQAYMPTEALIDGWGLAPGPYIISGGFPCQPFSLAGNRKGANDDRNLWPWMLRVIRRVRPVWVIGENVTGSLDYIDTVVRVDLEAAGYQVEIFSISAETIGAPHKRERLWILAYVDGQDVADSDGPRGRGAADPVRTTGDTDLGGGACLADSASARSLPAAPPGIHQGEASGGARDAQSQRCGETLAERIDWQDAEYVYCTDGNIRPVKPGVCLLVDGLPGRMDELRSLGNSIVPEIAELLFSVILAQPGAAY